MQLNLKSLKKARFYKKKGYSISEIARKLNTSRQQIYRWLNYSLP
jgi:transposase-like protein